MGYNSSYLDKFAFSYIDTYTIATNKEKERSKKAGVETPSLFLIMNI